MRGRDLIVALAAVLLASPSFVRPAAGRAGEPLAAADRQTAAATPAPSPAPVAAESLGSRVREQQRARLDEIRREHAQLRAQAESLARTLEHTRAVSSVPEDECRLIREIALALCAAAGEQERAMLRLDELLKLRDREPDSDRRRERDVDRHTISLEQHLGSMTYDLSELLKTIEAIRARLAAKP